MLQYATVRLPLQLLLISMYGFFFFLISCCCKLVAFKQLYESPWLSCRVLVCKLGGEYIRVLNLGEIWHDDDHLMCRPSCAIGFQSTRHQ